MAIAMTLRGFSDVGRSVTPIFLLIGCFVWRFSMFCEKVKKNPLSRILNILKHSIEFRSCHFFF